MVEGDVLEHRGGDPTIGIDAVGDDDLLRAVSRGDRGAFAALMERHARAMLTLATRVTRNVDEADEIVQDAFLKVWKMAPRWQPDREAKFTTWLYRVVLNASLDVRRRSRYAPLEDAGDPVDANPGGLDLAVAHQRDRLVAQALDDIPSRQRAALSLHYYAEMSAPQAALIMELTVPAVESLLVRGKRALRLALARRGITGIGDVT
ncbi:RNA polymerase sigma factor [Magnetospirillum fulvum]|uniref:RNA polymerase sigma factor n=1 Tax=Magnetospirillum fulvum TaxID=1082 RepID=UPI000941E052|nr:RNA polymerase sigma factor [Magnetospirillum fulvum]